MTEALTKMNCDLELDRGQASGSGEALDAPPKKRKVTYWARKDEACQLRQQLEELNAHLAVLKEQQVTAASTTIGGGRVGPRLRNALTDQHILKETVRRQQMQVAASQALLSHGLGDQQSHPLYTRICLSKNWDERRATLMAIRMQKLQSAYHFIMARCGSLDQPSMRFSDNRFETEQGDLDCECCDIQTFEGVKSLRQVYDAVMFFMTNMEISLSERLGHIAVRDDYAVEDDVVYNSRVILTNSHGVTAESSVVAFPHLFAEGDPAFGGKPCAVLAMDCIDEDELYPYMSKERVRRDASTAIVLTVSQRTPNLSERGDLVDITMRRAGFMKLHRPEFPVSEGGLQEVHDSITSWGVVMIKTIREMVYSQQ